MKFFDGRIQLQVVMSGRAPTGVGMTKASFEVSAAELSRLVN